MVRLGTDDVRVVGDVLEIDLDGIATDDCEERLLLWC
jgi:hypothetical protein